jgi:hypothetical protein
MLTYLFNFFTLPVLEFCYNLLLHFYYLLQYVYLSPCIILWLCEQANISPETPKENWNLDALVAKLQQ